MLSVLQPHNVTLNEVIYNSTVQNGICMVTHQTHRVPENAQNVKVSNATVTNNPFQESTVYPPSGATIPCEKSNSNNNNNEHNNNKNYNSKNALVGKNALVENLVDTTVLIIDVIWYNFPVNLNSQVIPLRVFIQETLRRSRTSWSTLQTALFYLMRIKPQITILWLNPDRWTLNSKDDDNSNNQGSDPATCGRRMFLASLIIASKYLQDRNYANNAWSKICGLPVREINVIERRFLKLIDYNLFIGEDVYKRWTNLLRSHIQIISGSDVTVEKQQTVAQLERTLQQCKVQ